MNLKKIGLGYLILVLMLILYSSVTILFKSKIVDKLPDREIVFQTEVALNSEVEIHSLGFINGNGEELDYLQFPNGWPWAMLTSPTWTSDGEYIPFFISRGDGMGLGGLSSLNQNGWEDSYFQTYIDLTSPIYQTHQVVMNQTKASNERSRIEESIQIYDLGKEEFVDLIYQVPQGEIVQTGNHALYEGTLVFSRSPQEGHEQLVLLDTQTGVEKILLEETYPHNPQLDYISPIVSAHLMYLYPAISPDGNWIAYTSQDGIYLISVDGGEPKRLMETCLLCEVDEDENWLELDAYWSSWPSVVSWSPDSQWLVYHRCLTCPKCGKKIEDYRIFKMNIETGEEVELVEAGLNPYWRLSTESETD